MARKNHKTWFIIAVLAIAAVSYFGISSFYPQAGTEAQQLPFGVKNFVQTQFVFNPFSLSITGTPAPAISCSLTNSLNLIATDGSSFPLSSTSPMFTPTYSLLIPNNGKQLASVNVKVFLWCNNPPSYYASSGYAPFLIGGTLQTNLLSHDSSGYSRLVATNPFTIQSTQKISGASVLLYSFDVPASQIQSIVGQSQSGFYSVSWVTTTGSLIFKQSLANSIQATYNIPNNQGVITAFSLQIPSTTTQTPPTNSPTPQPQTQDLTQSIDITSLGAAPYQIDVSKGSVISFAINVNNYMPSQENPPTIKLVQVDGAGSGTQVLGTFAMPATPNGQSSGSTSKWTGSFNLAQYGQNVGLYELQLAQVQTNSGTRASASIDFNVINSASSPPSSGGSPTQPCPAGQEQTQFGCLPVSNNSVPLGNNSTTTNINDVCTQIGQTFGPNINGCQGLQQLITQNIGIIIIVIIALFVLSFLFKGGKPRPVVDVE